MRHRLALANLRNGSSATGCLQLREKRQMYPHLEESELAQRVRLRMTAIRPELGGISVTVDHGTVRLSGQTATFYLRQLALTAAQHVAGVQHVVDDIEVPIPQEQSQGETTVG